MLASLQRLDLKEEKHKILGKVVLCHIIFIALLLIAVLAAKQSNRPNVVPEIEVSIEDEPKIDPPKPQPQVAEKKTPQKTVATVHEKNVQAELPKIKPEAPPSPPPSPAPPAKEDAPPPPADQAPKNASTSQPNSSPPAVQEGGPANLRSDEGQSEKKVIVVARLDAKIGCQKPTYPENSLRLGEEGSVRIGFLVGADGAIKESRIEKTSGFKRLDEAAKDALSLCKFIPRTENGSPVTSWAHLVYVWHLH